MSKAAAGSLAWSFAVRRQNVEGRFALRLSYDNRAALACLDACWGLPGSGEIPGKGCAWLELL